MSGMAPDPAPNVELELAKLANSAMAAGADPHLTTARLHRVLTYLRQQPELAAQATNALADGVATPADISQKVWQTLHADPNENPTAPTPPAAGVTMAPDEPQGATNPRSVPTFKQAGVHAAAELANAAQGIPGVRALEAGARSVVRRQPYREALSDIDAATGALPTSDRVIGQMIGAAPLAMMGGSPAITGALIGGADQALDANPDESPLKRGAKTVAGAVGGAVLGRVGDVLATKARAAFSPTFAREAFNMGDDAKLINNQNYGAAEADAAGKVPTPAIRRVLANPHFAPIAENISSLPQFEGMSQTDPRFLNEMYQHLSDTETGVRKGLAALDPTKKNSKDAQLDAIATLKQQLLSAMEEPGQIHIPPVMGRAPAIETAQSPAPSTREAIDAFHTAQGVAAKRTEGTVSQQMARTALERHDAENIVSPPLRGAPPGPRLYVAQPAETVDLPPYMPGYRGAVDEARQMKAEQRMFRTGYMALPANSTGRQLSPVAAMNLSPEALERIANDPTKSAGEKAKLVQGILASLKAAPTLQGYGRFLGTPFPYFSREARSAPQLIRAAGGQGVSDFLTKLGLLSAQPAVNQ